MTVDKINEDSTQRKDILWKTCVDDAEREIKVCQDKIDRLRKSIIFFKKQDDAGVPFPVEGKEEVKRHINLS